MKLLTPKLSPIKEANCHCPNNSSNLYCQKAEQSRVVVLFSRKWIPGTIVTWNLKEIAQVNIVPLAMMLFHWHHPTERLRPLLPIPVLLPLGCWGTQAAEPLSHYRRKLPATAAAESIQTHSSERDILRRKDSFQSRNPAIRWNSTSRTLHFCFDLHHHCWQNGILAVQI